MCGFVGFTNHIDNSNVVLGEMLDKIKHRGPDAEGTYIDEDIALGHRRLSIIDVSDAGTQPLYSEDGNLALLFNGEIYNYQEIRSRLMEAGYHFATQTDSEVVLAGEVGSWILYFLGMYGGNAFLKIYLKRFPKHKPAFERTFDLIRRKGFYGIFISKLIPMVRTLISIPAGVLKMEFIKYSIASFLGVTLWNTLFVGAGYIIGEPILKIITRG